MCKSKLKGCRPLEILVYGFFSLSILGATEFEQLEYAEPQIVSALSDESLKAECEIVEKELRLYHSDRREFNRNLSGLSRREQVRMRYEFHQKNRDLHEILQEEQDILAAELRRRTPQTVVQAEQRRELRQLKRQRDELSKEEYDEHRLRMSRRHMAANRVYQTRNEQIAALRNWRFKHQAELEPLIKAEEPSATPAMNSEQREQLRQLHLQRVALSQQYGSDRNSEAAQAAWESWRRARTSIAQAQLGTN